MAEEFKSHGYITGYELYADPHGFALKSLDGIPEEIDVFVEVLRERNAGAVLVDGVEDNTGSIITDTNKQARRDIRAEIGRTLGPEPYAFYENNKLQQGNIQRFACHDREYKSLPSLFLRKLWKRSRIFGISLQWSAWSHQT